MSEKECPGTKSKNAGKSEACEGCPNKSYCEQPKIEDPDIEIIRNNTRNISKTIAIISGKGGVGKSTITRTLSDYLSQKYKTLILDFDLSGPSIPKLTKTENSIVFESNNRIHPIKIKENLFCLSVGHFITEKSQIFNSTFKTSIIKKILKETVFDGITYLIIDTPPGVSDEHLGIVNFLKLDWAILVTTPQRISFNDVVRQIDFCRKTKIKIFGLVENMKKHVCKECNHTNYIFSGSGIEEFCKEKQINYLGDIDLEIEIAKKSDQGSIYESQILKNISDKIIEKSF